MCVAAVNRFAGDPARLLAAVWLAALFCAVPVPAVHAASGTPYGQEFVRLGVEWPEGRPRGSGGSVSAAGRTAQVVGYERQVAESETSGGPYTDGLAEPLAALARHRRDRGELQQAERLYRRALHVVRVNDGLYTQRQIPILRELLDTYRSSGDLATLDDRYDYFFRLYGRGQPPYSEVRMGAALEYLRWQREALRRGLDADDKRRLLALYELNDELLRGVAADDSADPRWYRQLSVSQLYNLYLIQDLMAPQMQNRSGVPNTPLLASDWDEQDFRVNRLETLQRDAVGHGARLLQESLSSGTVPPEELASMHLELGDWYQWNGFAQKASEQYGEVVRLLRETGRSEMLDEWLGEPVELPDNGAFWQPPAPEEGQRRVQVRASYDVSARGRANNIQTSVAAEEDEDVASSLRRKLARTRFRPRFSSGAAEAQAGVVRDYAVLD